MASRFNLFQNCVNENDFVRVGPASTFVIEEGVELSLHQAAEQALWDLKQWVKDHPEACECFTCNESIPDLERALKNDHPVNGVCC